MTTSRIRELDAWRGIAASLVFFHHLFVSFPAPFNNLRLYSDLAYQVAWFLSELNVAAILLFFVISGFSIHLSAHQLNMARADDINAYIYRRLKRLLPLYYVALALTLLVGIASSSSHDYSARVLIGNLFFLQTPASDRGNWFVPYGGNYPLWSLSFEMFFYVCYPLISRYLGNRNTASCDFVGYGTLIALGCSILGFVLYTLMPNPLALFASHFIIWYTGVVLAEAYLGKVDSRFAFGVIAALFCGAALASSAVKSTVISLICMGSLIAVALIAFFIIPPRFKETLKAAAKPIVFIFTPVGYCSYAIYLFHQPLIDFFIHFGLGQGANLIIVPIVCMALAASAEYLAGLPGYHWLKRRYLET